MDYKFRYLVYIYSTILTSSLSSADTFSVKVTTEQHVNLVDSKFLSFTIDPKYLFSSSEKYNTKECICMASSLTPAYIRIAGPSTSSMTFRNTTIAIDDSDEPKKLSTAKLFKDDEGRRRKSNLAVTHSQWEKFVQWAKNTGFDLVFALNSDEKTSSGMWDPNTALKILTVADQAKIGDIFWQLGYECNNQSIEEYLNDLETLRVIIETFPPGKVGRWQVVGGDVTHCLQADSKSDFKDYVTLSNDMMDAILLNGNSSSQELDRMSEKDRYKLLRLLSTSDTPLWLTESSTQQFTELERATDWMTSLGYSARNGFSVHYRELMEKELYEPTLSFYMALLFKNLVGERVLSVDIDASQAVLFAHCTSLRHKPVSGAITLYGANMDEEPARLSIKLTKKEEGGDIMQFILGHDHNGNIVVNNRPMYYEGDIRPVVKRVRPYKTLLLNLPPKSFGFWVLANTNVEACFELDGNSSNKLVKAMVDTNDKEESNYIKRKRAIGDNKEDNTNSEEFLDGTDYYEIGEENKALQDRIDSINNDLRNVQKIFQANSNRSRLVRVRRQTFDEGDRKFKKNNLKIRHNLLGELSNSKILQKLTNISKGQLSKLKNKGKRRSVQRNSKIKSKRNSKTNYKLQHKASIIDNNKLEMLDNSLVRKRRSPKSKPTKKYQEESSENEIPDDSKETSRFGKIFNKIKKISDLPLEIHDKGNDDYDDSSVEGIVLKTKVSDDGARIDITDKSHTGLLRSTLEDILSLMADFNKNLNRFWAAITILE